METPVQRRIVLKGVRVNNLKNVDKTDLKDSRL